MKRLLILLSFISTFVLAQVESIQSSSVGAYVDHTIVPLSPQSNYSHSQTIYHREQLKFRGYISGISYFKVFSIPSTTDVPVDPADLTIKIGTTNLDEFGNGNGFVADSELMEMTGILRSTSVYEVRYDFETPFYYDGTQNLVIDVEDHNPEASASATDGYRGVENFGNPPKRSIISLTTIFDNGTSESNTLVQNAYPQTKFYGELERCAFASVSNFENVTSSSAEVNLSYESVVTTVRYNISEYGEEIPDTYQTAEVPTIFLTDLLPAQAYNVNVKSDCDELPSTYATRSFKTRPQLLTVPYDIDFENGFNRDYNVTFGSEVLAEGANNSDYGMVLKGPGYPDYMQWNNYGDPFRNENKDFARVIYLDVDLTEGTTNPVLKFDIKQNFEAYFRVRIGAYGDDSYFRGIPQDLSFNFDSDDNEFRTVVYDLSDYVGEIITIKLEHISSSDIRKTYIDNIQLFENSCEIISNLSSESTLNTITLNWDGTSTDAYQIANVMFGDYLNASYNTSSTNSFNFENLELATPYKLFVKNMCEAESSPWETYYASTNPNFLEVGFDSFFNDSFLTNGLFSLLHSQSSQIESSSNSIKLFQRYSNEDWVGGEDTTEEQAWNDNMGFMSGLRFMIDGTTLNQGSVELKFKLQHHYTSVPLHSWFRIMVNGEQVGASYNPVTKNSDPYTSVTIDLEPYLGDVITFELQQVGRYMGEFTNTATSGDGVILRRITFTGETLNVSDATLSNLKVFPNPAKSNITIKGLEGKNIITIFNEVGSVIQQINCENSTAVINVSRLKTGVYFIGVEGETKQRRMKFIKE